MKRVALSVFALAVIAAVALPNFADDPHGKKTNGMSEEEAKMMEEMGKLATPGEHHNHMKPLVGRWAVKGKFRMDPAQPWQDTNSASDAEWILGGRFITQKVKGDPIFGPTPFEGFGFMGYDNLSKKYTHVWADNLGTMTMLSEGTCDASGKTITFRSEYTCPMTQKPTWMKSVYKIESNDKYTLTMSGPDQSGKEFVGMELVHTRKK